MNTALSASECFVLFSTLLVLGIASRFLPHAPGATAMTAVIFASAQYLGPRISLLLVTALLLISNAVIGGYELPVMLAVYGSFLLIAGMGVLFKRTKTLLSKGVVLVCSSVSFFLITNAAVWYFTPWYTKDLIGLMESYLLGLPFLQNMLVGDLIYTPVLLALIALVLKPARASSFSAYAS